jgi:hypothetical protein
MLKQIRNLAFCLALGAAPIVVTPVLVHAQAVDQDQRAYQMGYQNGVNDAQEGRAMNMQTSDWHGNRVNLYQQGYQKGYDSVKGYGRQNAFNPGQYQGEDQAAYQAGYQNGLNDGRNNRAMNMATDNWHGDRLNIYQRGYQQGFDSARGIPTPGPGAPVAAPPVTNYNPNTLTGEDQRTYQAGYQNGLSDAQNNRAMNISTDNWHGDRLPIYQQGYQDGYRSVAPPAR